jgi:ABC-type multidrug transport system fused ATPase/permease subunit
MISFDPYSIVIALNHLTDAVNIASQTNMFKDYIMPVFVVLLSALTAYFIAIRGYQYQEASKNERAKVDVLNKIILQMQNMQANIVAIKVNYFDSLETHPLQRALCIPMMPARIEAVTFESNELVQLLYSRKLDLDKYPWMNISSFVATYGNYNQYIELLTIRNKLDEDVKKQLASLISGTGAKAEVALKDVYPLLDESLLMKYVDLTEKFIVLGDDLLITINDFLLNFPSMASGLLKKKYISNYIFLKAHENNSEIVKQISKRCKKVDLDLLASIMKLDKEEAEKMYLYNSVVVTTPKE